ncbi:MAG: hypothetical protein IPO19_13745 [Rhodoferax sp.]|nr:hypothetical protein [Rhodoferax sp.]
MTEIVGEIALASAGRSSGIDQINEAITAADGMSRQNAALVRESGIGCQIDEDAGREAGRAGQVFKLAHNRGA